MLYFTYSLALLVAALAVCVPAQRPPPPPNPDGPDGPPPDPNAPRVKSVEFLIPDGTEQDWKSPVVLVATVGGQGEQTIRTIISGDASHPTTLATARVVCRAVGHPLPDFETNVSNVITYDAPPRGQQYSDPLGPNIDCFPQNTSITNCTYNPNGPISRGTVVYFNCGPKPTPNITFEATMYPALFVNQLTVEILKQYIPLQVAAKAGIDPSRVALRVTRITDQPPATENSPIYVANFNITDGPPPSKTEVQEQLAQNPYGILPSLVNVTSMKISGSPIPAPAYLVVELDGEDAESGKGPLMLHLSGEEEDRKGALCLRNAELTRNTMIVLCRRLGHMVDDSYPGMTVGDYGASRFADLKCDAKQTPIRYCTYQTVESDCPQRQVYLDCYKNKPPVAPAVTWTTQLNKTYYGNDFATAKTKFSTEMNRIFYNFQALMEIRQHTSDDTDNGIGIEFSPTDDTRSNKANDVNELYRLLASWANNGLFADALHFLEDLTYTAPPRTDISSFTLPVSNSVSGYSLVLSNTYRGVLYMVAPDQARSTISAPADVDFTTTAATTCTNVGSASAVLIGAPNGVGPHLTATYACPNYRCGVTGSSGSDNNHDNDIGIICAATAEPLPAAQRDTWVANIQLTVTSGFSWDSFTQTAVARFSALRNRLELLSNTDTTYTFYVKDEVRRNALRVDGEYFFLNSKFDHVSSISYTYGPPQWPADRFVPTDTTGWEWAMADTGLITVKPTGASDAGYLCYKDFPHIAAVAICRALGKDIGTEDPQVYVYVEDTPVTAGKMYINRIRCLEGDITKCSMDVDTSGAASCGDTPTKNAVYLQCGVSKDQVNYAFKGFVNFTVAMKTAEQSHLSTGLTQVLGLPSGYAPTITQLATSGEYSFYSVTFPRGSDTSKMVSANNKLINMSKTDVAKLYTEAHIYEIRSDREGNYYPPPENAAPANWRLALYTENKVDYDPVHGGADAYIGTLSISWHNATYYSLPGSLCGLGMNMASFTSAANSLCSSAGLRNLPSPGRILRNYGTGSNIMYFANLQNGLTFNQEYSSFFKKNNDCTLMDSVGLMCGSLLRAPPEQPVEYTLTLDDSSKQSSLQTCIANLMDLQASDVNIDGTKITFNDDNFAVYFMYLNEYQLKTKCGVTSKVVTVPYTKMTTAPTRLTKPPPPTPAPSPSGPVTPPPTPPPSPPQTAAPTTTSSAAHRTGELTTLPVSGSAAKEESSGPSIGPIIGGAVGGILVLALIGVGVFFFLKKRRAAEEGYDDLTTPMGDMNAAAVVTPNNAA